MNNTVAMISLSWDEYGRVTHRLQSFITTDDYQKNDALGLSVPLIIASQFGVLAPKYSIDLCKYILDYLSGVQRNPELIQLPLSSARIELIQKESLIVPVFHPSILEGGTMEPEEAVRRLLTSYVYHADEELIPEIVHYMRVILLAAVSYYLSEALMEEIKDSSFKLEEPTARLNLSMLDFTFSIFPQWQGGPSLQPARFKNLLRETMNQYDSVIKRIYAS